MSLFQCQSCGCCENTALASHGFTPPFDKYFDWTGMEEKRGMRLCSACGPTKYSNGKSTEFGVWHGHFKREFLPMGMFRTASNGNLEHINTGEQNYHKYAEPNA